MNPQDVQDMCSNAIPPQENICGTTISFKRLELKLLTLENSNIVTNPSKCWTFRHEFTHIQQFNSMDTPIRSCELEKEATEADLACLEDMKNTLCNPAGPPSFIVPDEGYNAYCDLLNELIEDDNELIDFLTCLCSQPTPITYNPDDPNDPANQACNGCYDQVFPDDPNHEEHPEWKESYCREQNYGIIFGP